MPGSCYLRLKRRNLALDGAFLGCRSTLTRDERATALMRAGAVIQILLFPLRRKLKRDHVDVSKEVGDVDHLKVFASKEAAEAWLNENDPEGVAFEYEVLE